MEDKKKIAILFNKYLTGEATEVEIEELLKLVKTEDADKDLDAEMAQFWDLQRDQKADHVDWETIYSRTVSADSPHKKTWKPLQVWMSAAAILICICSFAFFLRFHTQLNPAQTYLIGKARAGQTTTVLLSDGSKVTLNSGSELKYPARFNGNRREVYLKGEAYFNIRHESGRSFQVHSGNLLTTVLGTSFNIMAYPELSHMSVTVLTGKVAVKNMVSSKLVTLLPRQRANLNTEKQLTVDAVSDLSDLVAWREGKLAFDHATLEEITVKLSNKYGVSIKVANQQKALKKITGTFNKQSLEEIVKAITHLTGSRFTQTANNYTIY